MGLYCGWRGFGKGVWEGGVNRGFDRAVGKTWVEEMVIEDGEKALDAMPTANPMVKPPAKSMVKPPSAEHL